MILGIDTLTTQTRLCAGSVLNEYPASKDQAEALMDQIAETIHQAQAKWDDITAIVVLTGPGSFTGLRVGLAVAHGIGQARGIPILGVSVLKAFELLLPQNNPQRLLIDTRRKDVAVSYRPAHTSAFGPLVEMPLDAVRAEIETRPADISGNGIAMLADVLIEATLSETPWIKLDRLINCLQPEISGLARGYHAIECDPIYLRAPDITISTQKFEHQTLYKPE